MHQLISRVCCNPFRRGIEAVSAVLLSALVSLPSASAQEQMPIVVPEGFTIELVAGHPLVQHPTFAAFDDKGRLFLCENAGVNMSAAELEAALPNSIRLLEDTDGDGRFDRSTVFADKMTFPMGAVWRDGALYVSSPPYIWRLEDTDGDGVADRRDQLVGKFGYTGNGSSVHGCIFGPDGRLYWTDGYHGHEFRDSEGNLTSKREGSYIFSCRPDGSDVILHSGGGMDNPVELDFTPAGEVLGTVNILYTRPRVDAFVHWLYGGAYPHRERVLNEIQTTGELLGPVHRFGHVAVSGTMRYRSGLLDPDWKDNFFTAFFNTGKVVRLELKRKGSTYTAAQREFLSCADRDFHPTDVIEDADGSLLVVNTGGWFYRGCPTSQHAKPEILGGVYRIRRTGMPQQDDPRGLKIDWDHLSNDALIGFLDDSRSVVRERALTTCVKRGESITASLKNLGEAPSELIRLNAVWALVQMGNGPALLGFLNDASLDVRLAALHGLSLHPVPAANATLQSLLNSDQAPIRRSAAVALGRSGDRNAIPSLLQALSRPMDRPEEHAIIFALLELNDPEKTRAGLQSDNLRIRRGALIALDQMKAGDLKVDDVLPFFDSSDGEITKTSAKIFVRHPEWANNAASLLQRLLENPNRSAQNAEILELLVRSFVDNPAVAAVVGDALANDQLAATSRHAVIKGVAARRNLPLPANWVAPLKAGLKVRDLSKLEQTLDVLAAVQGASFADDLRELSSDETLPVLLRVRAIQIAEQKGTLPESAFELMDSVFDEGSPQERLKVAQRLGTSSLNAEQQIRLAARLQRASPAELKDLIRPFAQIKSNEAAEAFLEGIQGAISFTTLSENELSDIILSFPADLRPVANGLLDQLRAHRQGQLALLDSVLSSLKEGDPKRGAEVFFSEKAKCSTCHQVGGRGGKVGPDLSMIGANRSGPDLLESIIFPSATIVRDYESYSIATEDGQVLTGLIARETEDTLYLQQANGEIVEVPRSQIEEMAPGTTSIMPAGLEQVLTRQELADVVAYLQSLNQPASQAAK